MKILILLPNNLGDVITALPVLESLKKKYRESHITFLVEEGFEGGLINCSSCDRIELFPRKLIRDITRSGRWSDGVAELQLIIRELKAEQFDLLLNLSQQTYISYLVTAIGAKEVRGKHFLHEGVHAIDDVWSQYLYAIPFAREFNELHVTDIYKRIAGTGDGFSGESLQVRDCEKQEMSHYLLGKGVHPGAKVAVLQPGAAYDAKRWPVEKFILLGKKLQDDGYTIVLTGARSERVRAEKIAQALSQRIVITTGELSFRETIALVSVCTFCVTGDTAIMHAASLLHIKVFALFGPTNPVETGPYGEGNIVFSGRCTHRPCFCFDCKSNECMKSISPDVVYAHIKGEEGRSESCDIYRTSIKQGVFRLQAANPDTAPYYNQVGATITRSIFEKRVSGIEQCDASEIFRNCSLDFTRSLATMESALLTFLAGNDIEHIRTFDLIRMKLSAAQGISAFYNAILNIRLNSVPLIQPLIGIKKSIEACHQTRQEISGVFSA